MSHSSKCEGCRVRFFTEEDASKALSMFCGTCKIDFGISTEDDAENILALLDMGLIDREAIKSYNQDWETPTQRKEPMSEKLVVVSKPKIEPEAVAAGVRALVDHKIAPTALEKPITYATYKNGLFEIRTSPLCTITTRPKEVLGVTEEGKEGVTWNLPKVPFTFLIQTISFFRGVCKMRGGSSEAIVQIWWDMQEKVHIINVPDHDVSGASVRHRSSFDRDNSGRYIHVMDIHSHGSGMSAFWSGTDNADESKITTERMFGVIGKVDQPVPEWLWRLSTRGGFIPLNITDVFEIPDVTTTNFVVKMRDIFRLIGDKDAYKNGRIALDCPVAPITSVDVPAEWYEKVKGHRWETTRTQHAQHGWNGASRFPNMKGYVYISGEEFEVDGTTVKATGNKLLKKEHQQSLKA